MANDLPRWTDRSRMHPIEREIHDLVQEVENAGSHPDLSMASVHLFGALQSLVQWFDAGQPGIDFDAGNERPLTLDDERLIAESWEKMKPYFALPPYGGTGSAEGDSILQDIENATAKLRGETPKGHRP